MKRRIAISSICLCALVLIGGAPHAFAGVARPEVQEIGLLFVHTAKRGTLEKIEGRRALKLKLSGVSRQVVWFQDRPGRAAGNIPIRRFIRSWAGFGFADSRPNAALVVLDGRAEADTAVFKLSAPRYRRSNRTLRYFARPLPEATGNLAHFENQRDRRVPLRFAHASLFIDDATGQVVNGCLVQPYSICDGADLSGADLSGVDLNHAHIWDANLDGVDLSGADLSGVSMYGTSFRGANLGGANLTQAGLQEADFTNADLSGAELRYADARYAILTDVDLLGADLYQVDLRYSKGPRAYLRRANLEQARLGESDFSEADFGGAYLYTADLRSAIFWKANFRYANLASASVPLAVFDSADLRYATLRGAIGFDRARISADTKFCRTILPNGAVDNADCNDSGLRGG